jgi:hypothetical protein
MNQISGNEAAGTVTRTTRRNWPGGKTVG